MLLRPRRRQIYPAHQIRHRECRPDPPVDDPADNPRIEEGERQEAVDVAVGDVLGPGDFGDGGICAGGQLLAPDDGAGESFDKGLVGAGFGRGRFTVDNE